MMFLGLRTRRLRQVLGSFLPLPKGKVPTIEKLCVLLNTGSLHDAQVRQACNTFLQNRQQLQQWTVLTREGRKKVFWVNFGQILGFESRYEGQMTSIPIQGSNP